MTRPPDPQVADQVLKYLTGARWFAGKGRQVELVSLTPLPWLTEVSEFFGAPGAPAVRFEIAEVRYPPDEDPDDDTDVEIDHEFYQTRRRVPEGAADRPAPCRDRPVHRSLISVRRSPSTPPRIRRPAG